MTKDGTISSDEIIRWLMIEGPRLEAPSSLLNGYSLKLREAGLQVDRSTLGAPILHPIAKSSFVFWDRKTGPEQRWFVYTPNQLEILKGKPDPQDLHARRADVSAARSAADRGRYPIGDDLWAEGYHQYEAIPLEFADGTFKVLTLATQSPDGFAETDRALIDATLPALTLVFEGFIARNTARTLMETYVGTRAGLRVLDGEIARGDGSTIDAVIWFSDLRGFTSLAQSRSEDDLLKLLNDYFGTLTDAIEANSGEVLKFIGDALLAVFPHQNDVGTAVARAEAAALQVIGGERSRDDYTFGIGLHPGSVFYGNVGGGNRLDFTVIGSSVNIASRIEGLCGVLGETVLASGDFAAKSNKRWRSVGHHELKGVAAPLEIYAPGASLSRSRGPAGSGDPVRKAAPVVPPPVRIVAFRIVGGPAGPVFTQEDHRLFVMMDVKDRIHHLFEDAWVPFDGDLELDHRIGFRRSGLESFHMRRGRGARLRLGGFLADSGYARVALIAAETQGVDLQHFVENTVGVLRQGLYLQVQTATKVPDFAV